jgi:hypothetical protein
MAFCAEGSQFIKDLCKVLRVDMKGLYGLRLEAYPNAPVKMELEYHPSEPVDGSWELLKKYELTMEEVKANVASDDLPTIASTELRGKCIGNDNG